MRKQLILIFALIIIIPLGTLGILITNTSYNVLEEQITENTNQKTVEVARYLNEYFEGYNKALVTLSNNENALKINNGANYEVGLLKQFEIFEEGYPMVVGSYMGTTEGVMVYAGETSDGYDPRIRPWYIVAQDADGPIWTDPYTDNTSGKLMVTAAIPVYDGSKFLGVIGLDINIATLSEIILDIKIGSDGYVFLTDSQDNVLLHQNPDLIGAPIPVEEIVEGIKGKESDGLHYEYGGDDKYLYFTGLDAGGWTLFGAQSQTELKYATAKMRNTVLVITFTMIILAFIVATIYSKYPTSDLKKIVSEMEKVKDGDLSSHLEIKSKTEIGEVGENFNLMVNTLGSLVENISEVVKKVEVQAETLAATSEETSASATEVSKAVDEIAQGATSQAHDTNVAVNLTTTLDSQFATLLENTDNMLKSAEMIEKGKEVGISSVRELQIKTQENSESTTVIGDAINGLDAKSGDIGNILVTISSIAEQTNLLALNASIEAARAGEHGRGFAVVADEIRKLAEESSTSAEQIGKIVTDIQNETKRTVVIMEDVKKRSDEQNKAVADVNDSFEHISVSIEEIGGIIKNTGDFISEMNDSKGEIVASIESISSVSEQSAASAQEVTASMEQQNVAIEEVATAAEGLSHLASDLNHEIEKFRL